MQVGYVSGFFKGTKPFPSLESDLSDSKCLSVVNSSIPFFVSVSTFQLLILPVLPNLVLALSGCN